MRASLLVVFVLAPLLSTCTSAGTRAVPAVNSPDELAAQVAPATRSRLSVTPKKLSLLGTGTKRTRIVVVSERGYRGKFSVTNTCAKIARISPMRGHGPSLLMNVSPIALGTCAIEVADAKHQQMKVPVDVTKTGLAFRILVPTKHPDRKSSRRGLGPRYVSPSTLAMSVDITGPTNENLVFGLTDLSSNCSVTIDGLECSFGTGLAPCSDGSKCYTATAVTYDAYDAAYDAIPAGANGLSIASETFSVTSGQSTNVGFAFSGIPAQIALVPNSPFVTQNGNAFTLVGPRAHSFLAEALDADRNIIAGIGAPAFAVTASGALGLKVTQPPEGSPNFKLTPPATTIYPSTISSVTVSATFGYGSADGCAQPGASCTGSFAVSALPLIAFPGANYGTLSYYGFSIQGSGESAPLLTLVDGIDQPSADVFDSLGNLYVANTGNSTVTEYPLGATTPSETISSGVSSPSGLAFDPSGNIFVLNGNATIVGYKPGAAKPFITRSIAHDAQAFAVDAAEDLWVLVPAPLVKGFYSAGGSVTLYPGNGSPPQSLSGYSEPIGVALDSSGWLYIAGGNQSSCTPTPCAPIWGYAPGTLNSPLLLYGSNYASSPPCGITSLVQGPDGNVYNQAGCEFGGGQALQTNGESAGTLYAPGQEAICPMTLAEYYPSYFNWTFGACI